MACISESNGSVGLRFGIVVENALFSKCSPVKVIGPRFHESFENPVLAIVVVYTHQLTIICSLSVHIKDQFIFLFI